ncbi:MAG TPA: hypothetical protein VEL74_20780 [Thermoanaerobaculia bacterium]|nr:hypothetical protein [Thermoanaerobaculia bacterium]
MSTDEDLAALHRRTSDPAHRAGCPAPGALLPLVSGSAAPAERERLVDHVAGCTACAEEVRLMRSLRPWSEGLARRLEGGEPRRMGRRLLPLSLAAALLAAVVGSAFVLRWDLLVPPDAGRLRSAPAERVSPAPDAVLQEVPAELAWEPQTGATGYRLRIFDEEANRLWEGAILSETKGAIPPEARSRLRPGASYFWTVEVEGPARRRELGPYWFRLADP